MVAVRMLKIITLEVISGQGHLGHSGQGHEAGQRRTHEARHEHGDR